MSILLNRYISDSEYSGDIDVKRNTSDKQMAAVRTKALASVLESNIGILLVEVQDYFKQKIPHAL